MVPDRFLAHPLRWLLPIQAALLFANLDLLPVWGDEQFTLDVVALPWGELGTALAADIHPPLYFALLKVWMAMALAAPIVWARALSAVFAVAATVAIDRLWLREVNREARFWFLAFWCLSPLLLLYARMARSYSLQALLAAVVFWIALRAASQSGWRWAAGSGFGIAALLYTHYLPGLAVGAAVLLVMARKNWKGTLLSAGIAVALYLPWLPVLMNGMDRAAGRDVYLSASGVAREAVLRLGYLYTTFSFGEAHDWLTFGATVCLTPFLLFLLRQGALSDKTGIVFAALAAAPIALLGTWKWVAYAFTPARLLFLLAAYLLALALGVQTRATRLTAAALLALQLVGVGFYFARDGFLNPGYLVPYGEIAQRIEAESGARDSLVLADALNADPKPLVAALPAGQSVVVARGSEFPEQVGAAINRVAPSIVWRLRSSRDPSPDQVHSTVEARLARDYELVASEDLLPYNGLQRTLAAVFAGGDPPVAYFLVERWERRP